jgi:hypothetical protein
MIRRHGESPRGGDFAMEQARDPECRAELESCRRVERAPVQRELGNEALQRYRDSEKDGRTTILSVAATYADADWDETIAGP